MKVNPLQDFIKADLGVECSTDPWVLEFILECLDLYGAPMSLEESMSFEDELYHTFSSAALTITMKSMRDEWEELRYLKPGEAALAFAEIYKRHRNDDLIPPFSVSQPD